MSTSKAYTVTSTDLDGNIVDQITTSAYTSGIDDIILRANGQIIPGFAATGRQAPKITFTTTNLYAALALGVSGFAVTGTSHTAKFWLQKYTALGGLDSGNTAIKMTMTKGMVLPGKLTAGQTNAATLELEAIPVYDGTNAPILCVDSQAIPAASQTQKAYVAGPFKYASTLIEGVQSIDIDFGLSEVLHSSSGEPYNTFLHLGTINPVITIVSSDMSLLASIGPSGIQSDITLYLKAVDPTAMRVADATASHIKMTATRARITVKSHTANQGQSGTCTLQVRPVHDGTNAIFTVNTASAIS